MVNYRLLYWLALWVGWFALSPQTLVPGAIAVGVGVTIYKERAINIVTVAAAWMGFVLYLAMAGGLKGLPEQANVFICISSIFALIVLGMRFPLFGFFMMSFLMGLISRGGGGYYYGRGRRWY